MRHDAIASETAKIFDRSPAVTGMALEKCLKARCQVPDDIGPDRMIEHRGGADLDRPAAEQRELDEYLAIESALISLKSKARLALKPA